MDYSWNFFLLIADSLILCRYVGQAVNIQHWLVLFWQIVIWYLIPKRQDGAAAFHNHAISLVILLQYIPRVIIIFPLNQRIVNTTGAVAKTAWAGAAYNLLLYILASHVSTCSTFFD